MIRICYSFNFCRKLRSICNVRFLSNEHVNVRFILQNNNVGDILQIKGWVKTIRNMKNNIFLDISDGSSSQKLQIQFPKELKPADLTVGSSIIANGKLGKAPKGNLELNATTINLLGKCGLNDGYPFAPRKTYSPEYMREYIHLRSRTNLFNSMIRVRSATTYAIYDFFNKRDFINIHTPIFTTNDCEGAGEVFTVLPDKSISGAMPKSDSPLKEHMYFDSKVFLTVSGQLHLEALCHGLTNVYTFGPTFRAENSRSRFHLSEFYMLEAEVGFVDQLEDIMHLLEDLIKSVTKSILNTYYEDILKCQREKKMDFKWLDRKFNIITYDDALAILRKELNQLNCESITKDNEVYLVEYFDHVPTFVINFPKEDKPFYMKECPHDNNKVLALDLLGPQVGEIAGGSLRENNYEKLKARIPTENLNWYIDLRKFGGIPTGGFGLGFERYLQMILGINSIKDCIPFPRWPHNCPL